MQEAGTVQPVHVLQWMNGEQQSHGNVCPPSSVPEQAHVLSWQMQWSTRQQGNVDSIHTTSVSIRDKCLTMRLR